MKEQQDIIKELRVCHNPDCGKEYEAEIISILGAHLIKGEGYCPECAREIYEERQKRAELVRQASIASTRRRWRETCGLPPKFMNEDFSTFKKKLQPKAFEKCWEYAEEYPLEKARGFRSLILFSENSWGVGKTHLACSVVHRILDRWNGEDITCPVRFITEPDLYRRIQATYNYSSEERGYRESEQDIIKQLISCRLLILDDLGKEKRTDPRFVQRILFSIIDGRYRYQLPMVITTNLSQERLKLYLGGGVGDEASYDRLIEVCGRKFIRIEGKSYRRHESF